MAFAATDAAREATSTFNSSHAFSATGLIPYNVEKPLASRYVRPIDEDVERMEEAKSPHRLHTGSRVLTTPEFLQRLADFAASKERTEAMHRAEARERALELLDVQLPPVVIPVPVVVPTDPAGELGLLGRLPKAFLKLTAAADRIDPSVPDGE